MNGNYEDESEFVKALIDSMSFFMGIIFAIITSPFWFPVWIYRKLKRSRATRRPMS